MRYAGRHADQPPGVERNLTVAHRGDATAARVEHQLPGVVLMRGIGPDEGEQADGHEARHGHTRKLGRAAAGISFLSITCALAYISEAGVARYTGTWLSLSFAEGRQAGRSRLGSMSSLPRGTRQGAVFSCRPTDRDQASRNLGFVHRRHLRVLLLVCSVESTCT